MRVLVDLGSHVTGNPQIVQVERTPESGAAGGININGKYVLPIFKGAEFPVDQSSYVLAGGVVDGGDISSISMAHMLADYPMFSNVYFNPLLTAAHVDEIDFTAQFRDIITSPGNVYMFGVRIQTGRPTSMLPDPVGQMPTHTAIMPINRATTPDRPGVLITQEIDLSTYMPDGTDNFLVYWKLLDFDVSQDVVQGTTNEPSVRTVTEPDQEPDDFAVFLSPDNGVSWCQVGLLEPVGFCDKTQKIRVAFVNRSDTKIYLANYAVLF
jgi:hypothetical protein